MNGDAEKDVATLISVFGKRVPLAIAVGCIIQIVVGSVWVSNIQSTNNARLDAIEKWLHENPSIERRLASVEAKVDIMNKYSDDLNTSLRELIGKMRGK